MDEFIPWFHQALNDNERLAREALHPDAISPGVWTTEHHNSEHHSEPNRCHIAEDRSGHYWSVAHEVFIPIGEHIARWDPARVLRQVAADRRILAEYERLLLRDRLRTGPYWDGARDMCEMAVRARAEAYDDQPGYREVWRQCPTT